MQVTPRFVSTPAFSRTASLSNQAMVKDAPRFGGPFGGRTTTVEKLVIGAIVLIGASIVATPFIGFMAPGIEKPNAQNTIGTVKPNSIMPTYTVTKNNEVYNSFGAKAGSFDSEGQAFDAFGNIRGYGTPEGRVYQLSGKGKEQLVGSIGPNGLFEGQFAYNNANFGFPGLTRAQQAAVAAIVIPANQ